MTLHILHGGIENGDKRWLERAAHKKLVSRSWIAPKNATPNDEVVIFVGSAFFATARICSAVHSRFDWARGRYGAAIDKVKLIKPPISIGIIQSKIPRLSWAKYPRSIATPDPSVSNEIRHLIRERQSGKGRELKKELFGIASIEELRAKAYADAKSSAPKKSNITTYRVRSRPVHRYVLARADGVCEGCNVEAPFLNLKRNPYLEPHHTTRLADDGPDRPNEVLALCPTCHSRVHHSHEGLKYNQILQRKLRKIEARFA